MTLRDETSESHAGAGDGAGASGSRRPAPRRLRWTDVFELEARLEADAAWPPEDLHARDRAIGARIDARACTDRDAVIAWLDALASETGGAGARAQRLREQLAAVLMIAGFLVGVFSVSGWLASGGSAPVNVIDLWPLLVGGQITLIALWLLAAVPRLAGWPIIGPLQALLRDVLAWIPRATAAVVSRFASGTTESWGQLLARLRALDGLYGRLRFWLLARLSQVFAIAFNLGAITAFIVMPTIDDPAFGWRSRLLDEAQIVAASDAVSAPLAWLWPEARPGEEVVHATRYSTVDQRYAGRGVGEDASARDEHWAAWWPFLLASLIGYGLLPRILYWTCAVLGARRALARLSFERPEIQRVLGRMRQSVVETRATGREVGALIDDRSFSLPSATSFALERMVGVQWESVALDPATLSARLAERFGPTPEPIGRVGGADQSIDAAVLTRLRALEPKTGLFLTMASWEPPVGDPIDFVQAARAALRPEAPIVVALYNRAPDGSSIPPDPAQSLIWRRRVARLGDPFIGVEALVEASAEDPESDVTGGPG